MEHDLSKLEHRLQALDQRVTEFNSIEFAKKLQAISRKPPFTSVAEFAFVMNAVEALTHSVEGSIQQCKQLLDAAQQIRKAGAVTTAA